MNYILYRKGTLIKKHRVIKGLSDFFMKYFVLIAVQIMLNKFIKKSLEKRTTKRLN